MTSITQSISSYTTHFDLAAIKIKAKNLISRIVTQHPQPNESMVKAIARKAFEALAVCLTAITCLLALAPLSAAFALNRAFQPPSYYIIESATGHLTKAEILTHLQHLKSSRKNFETIEFRQATNAPKLKIDDEMLSLLKDLCSATLIFPSRMDSDLYERLDAATYYYSEKIYRDKKGVTRYCLERKNKIKHLVLSPDPNKMLDQLRKLVEANERVSNIFYTRVLPKNMEIPVKELVIQLHPSLELLIDNKNKHSEQALGALLGF